MAVIMPALSFASERSIGDVLCRLAHLAGELDAESMTDERAFLGDW